jgi:hypothetical protein
LHFLGQFGCRGFVAEYEFVGHGARCWGVDVAV